MSGKMLCGCPSSLSVTRKCALWCNLLIVYMVYTFIYFVVYSGFFLINVACADQPVSRGEYSNKYDVGGGNSGSDETPFFMKVGRVEYKIPNNYILIKSISIPTLKVTVPGLSPLTEKTRSCFEPQSRADKLGCVTIELRLHGGMGPDGPSSSEEMFRNFMKGFRGVVPVSGPFGYSVYSIGPKDDRIEVYTMEKSKIYFTCKIFYLNDQKDAICEDTVDLYDKNIVKFFFRLDKIRDIPEIEVGIRGLMASFVVTESGK